MGSAALGTDSALIFDDDSPWHNFGNTLDVSGNGIVSPLDVLLVINLLNSGRGATVYGMAQPADGSKLYADTNNDEVISPLDVLLVINQLNKRGSGSPEGEAAVPVNWSSLPRMPDATSFDLALQDFDYSKRRKI